MAGEEDTNVARPSFTSFWKRSKEALTARKITFVPSTTTIGPGAGDSSGVGPSDATDTTGGENPENQSEADKAHLRRAQVRKAQIQHRQRKANYVKKLEIDIAHIRDLIANDQRDFELLRAENGAMRTQLRDMVGQLALPGDPLVPGGQRLGRVPAPGDMKMELDFDHVLNAPSFRIASPQANTTHDAGRSLTLRGPSSMQGQGLQAMSPEQTGQAINFILALEHICWDHFTHSDFQPNAEPMGLESGHTLMASSLALRTAPASVFNQVITTKQNMRSLDATVRGSPIPPDVSWQASGLTLQSLYGLASSVNPSDLDMTPVQAWFELAAEYPTELLLRPDIMDTLKTELIGVVKCPHYGAVIERSAFESVVGRILDPPLAAWRLEQQGIQQLQIQEE